MLYFALLLRILANPLANVFQKKLTSSGVPASEVNMYAYVFAFFVSLVCLHFSPEVHAGPGVLLLCLFSGFLGATGNFFLIKALESGELSVLGPINSYKPVCGIIFGILVLGEYPDFYALLGVAAIIFGSYFMFESKGAFNADKLFNRAIAYRIAALALASLEAVFLKKIIIQTSAEFGFCAWATTGVIFSLPFVALGGRQKKCAPKISKSKQFLFFGLTGAFVSAMQLSTNWVFAYMQVGLALALFQLSGVISVILGLLFFGEKNFWPKLAGSLIMCMGAAAVIL